MQVSRCPECYVPIGGDNHTLLTNNRRDTEMEGILREQGAQLSPFAWGR